MSKAKRVAHMGMLFGLAMALAFFERFFVPLVGLAPGVKLGLSNVVIMLTLAGFGWIYAVWLCVLKACFMIFTHSVSAAVLSLFGGILSILAMLLMRCLRMTVFIQSCVGAICHNFGQLIALNLIFTQTVYTFYYFPVLLLSGLLMGGITAGVFQAICVLLRCHIKIFGFIDNNSQ